MEQFGINYYCQLGILALWGPENTQKTIKSGGSRIFRGGGGPNQKKNGGNLAPPGPYMAPNLVIQLGILVLWGPENTQKTIKSGGKPENRELEKPMESRESLKLSTESQKRTPYNPPPLICTKMKHCLAIDFIVTLSIKILLLFRSKK